VFLTLTGRTAEDGSTEEPTTGGRGARRKKESRT
jgi:hypothetical protein